MSDAPQPKRHYRPLKRDTGHVIDHDWNEWLEPPASSTGRYDDGIEDADPMDVYHVQALAFDKQWDLHAHLADKLQHKCTNCGNPCRNMYCVDCRWKGKNRRRSERGNNR